MVPLSKSGGRKASWVRIPPSPPFKGEVLEWPIRRAWRARVVFGDRGFESHPLRQIFMQIYISAIFGFVLFIVIMTKSKTLL